MRFKITKMVTKVNWEDTTVIRRLLRNSKIYSSIGNVLIEKKHWLCLRTHFLNKKNKKKNKFCIKNTKISSDSKIKTKWQKNKARRSSKTIVPVTMLRSIQDLSPYTNKISSKEENQAKLTEKLFLLWINTTANSKFSF